MDRLLRGTDSLTRELSVPGAEAEFAGKVRGVRKKIPFGVLNEQWEELKAKMAPGDTVWEFKLRGRGRSYRGVKLVRRGKVSDCIMAEMSDAKPPKPQIGRRDVAWGHVESGEYHQAVLSYTSRLRRDKSTANYCNRGIAYLGLGEYDEAIADFRAADGAHPSSSDDCPQRVGMAQWLAGRELEAASTWHDLVIAFEQGKIHYTDAGGGVESPSLLWFAAVCSGQPGLLKVARRLLRALASAQNGWIDNWPGPVAKFLLGGIGEERLRSLVTDTPILRDRERCQAEFYIGVRRLQRGDRAGARDAFRAAARLTNAKCENEYYLAVCESKRPAPGEKSCR
jgi:tetratricopeptide (TPR) repeat protein